MASTSSLALERNSLFSKLIANRGPNPNANASNNVLGFFGFLPVIIFGQLQGLRTVDLLVWVVNQGGHSKLVIKAINMRQLFLGIVLFFCVAPLSVSAQTACDESCSARSKKWFQCDRCTSDPGALFQWRCQSADAGIATLNEPLVTDRPDFTEAGSVVGLGVLQIETGYTYTHNDDNGQETKSHSYPETLFRYGVLADWLELRVAWNYGDEETNGIGTDGSDDLYLGFKIGLTPQDGIRPEMALIPQMTVPTGASDRTNDEVLAGLNWQYAWSINETIATGGSTQFNRALDEATQGAYTEWAQSWTIAYSLTDRLGAYTEYFGFYPNGADTASPEHYFNGGFALLANNDLQFDIRGGTGLNADADDYFVGAGLSVRFR
jgi:hypothetical protein